MASQPLILLLTRPAEASQRFAQGLAPETQARVTLCVSPLIGIAPRTEPVDPGLARGLVFSSVNGVRAAAGLMAARDLPCFCVGAATARAAREAGWTVAREAEADADALVAALLRDPPEGPLLHLRGVHARGDIAGRLTAGGLRTDATVVYDQPELTLTDAARDHLAGSHPVIVPLFSPRSASLFAAQHAGPAPLYVQAMSPAVAREVERLNVREMTVAKAPTGAEMRKLVESCVDGLDRVEGDRGPQ